MACTAAAQISGVVRRSGHAGALKLAGLGRGRVGLRGMQTLSLNDKARLLWTRRHETSSVWMYIRQNARRHLVYAAIFWSAIALTWFAEVYAMSFVLLGFWGGRLSRDIAWYRRLSAEWDSTRELLDWHKIELLANEAAPSPSP